MGLEKFQQRFSEVTHDESTAGMIAASDQYYRCRRQVNDAQARTLPTARQRQIRDIRRAFDALGGTVFDYTDIAAGGGTMWRITAAYDTAAREDALGGLIADLRRPVSRSRTARRQAETALAAARSSFTSLAHPEAPSPGLSGPDALTVYKSSYAASRAALARLTASIRALPDRAARRLARETAHILAEPARNLETDAGTR